MEKINDHPVHTIPNHRPTKMDVLLQTFLHIILTAKWLVRHTVQVSPPTSSDDLCILFSIYPSSIYVCSLKNQGLHYRSLYNLFTLLDMWCHIGRLHTLLCRGSGSGFEIHQVEMRGRQDSYCI